MNSSSASVKVVKIITPVEMGNNCSNCSCVCEKVSLLQHCQARAGTSSNQSTSKPSDPKKSRLGGTPSRKIEVITIESSDDDDDNTTIEWESSSSEEDVQILDQRIRN